MLGKLRLYASAALLSLWCLTSSAQTNAPSKADAGIERKDERLPDLEMFIPESKSSFPSIYQRTLLGKIAESRLLLTVSDRPYEEMKRIGENTLKRSVMLSAQHSQPAVRLTEFLQDKAVDPINDRLNIGVDAINRELNNLFEILPGDEFGEFLKKHVHLGEVNVRLGISLADRVRLYEEPFLNEEEKRGGRMRVKLGIRPNISYEARLPLRIRTSATAYANQMRFGFSMPVIDNVRIEAGVAVKYDKLDSFKSGNRSYLTILKRSEDGSFAYGIEARMRGSPQESDGAFGDRGSKQTLNSIMLVGSFNW